VANAERSKDGHRFSKTAYAELVFPEGAHWRLYVVC
jgi:hypothetical protein